MNLEHYKRLKNIIQDAEQFGLLLEAQDLTGFSGKKLIGTLQRLAQYQSNIGAGCYLEIGVFQGLTLISVATAIKDNTVYGIDNFSQFDPKKINQSIINKNAINNNINNICLINADYEDTLENLRLHIGKQQIGTYFIDGPHDYRSQLVCLQLAKPYLSDLSVIVVDDCNYRHVRLANRDFMLANPKFKLLFEAYTECHPANMNKNLNEEVKKGWWNGVNIIVYDTNDILNTILPETFKDRLLYENEHIIHSAKYGYLAPEAVAFIQSIMSLRLFRALKQLLKIVIKARQMKNELFSIYEAMNTYSEKLPQKRFNSTIM